MWTRWNFESIFLKIVHQKGLFDAIKKKSEFSELSWDSPYLLAVALKAVHVTTIHVTVAALCSFVQPDNMSRQMEAIV